MQTPLLQELDEMYLIQKFELLIKQAYQQGVSDGKAELSYPPVLTKDHLVEILQVKKPTVDKIIKDYSFPRLKTIQARYPRDAVFAWIESNTAVLDKYIS